MHFVKVKGILSSSNGMNLYRGCSHGCIYCDSRSLCYHVAEDGRDFEDIEVKENALELLEAALKRKKKKCMIGTGAMTDPYIPLEYRLEYTKGALELIEEYGFGVCVQTKSDRVLRDIELLQRINKRTKAVVQMTLTTADEKLCKILEPKVCGTKKRFEALKRLKEAGIPTVVWLDPILPFINDTKENIEEILEYCAEANVYGVICFGMGLTLRAGNREYFYKKLDEHFPGLKKVYEKTFGFKYEVNSPDNGELMRLFHGRCGKYGMAHRNEDIFGYMYRFEDKNMGEQLSFLDI
ncbi:MAG: radical SAM protein [Ruminiclostridium sp.]|nr:radical SAM protein [Ruminiclostridium sp.]